MCHHVCSWSILEPSHSDSNVTDVVSSFNDGKTFDGGCASASNGSSTGRRNIRKAAIITTAPHGDQPLTIPDLILRL